MLERLASSLGRNVRPTTGLTPSTSKKPWVTHWRGTFSGVPSGLLMTIPPTFGKNPAIPSNGVLFLLFQSIRLRGRILLNDDCLSSLPEHHKTVWVAERKRTE